MLPDLVLLFLVPVKSALFVVPAALSNDNFPIWVDTCARLLTAAGTGFRVAGVTTGATGTLFNSIT